MLCLEESGSLEAGKASNLPLGEPLLVVSRALHESQVASPLHPLISWSLAEAAGLTEARDPMGSTSVEEGCCLSGKVTV